MMLSLKKIIKNQFEKIIKKYKNKKERLA